MGSRYMTSPALLVAMGSLSLALLLVPCVLQAEVPVPVYPDCGVAGDLSACPSETAGDWKLWGHTPAELEATLRPEEIELGIGNAVTEAW